MRNPQTSIFLAFVFTVLFGTSAYAVGDRPTVPPGGGFDVNLLFEDDGLPMELAMLTPQEMADTEGAWTWAAIRQAFTSGLPARVIGSVRGLRVKIHYDRKPHYFTREEWGHLEGNRPHFQITIWRDGVKGSHQHHRIPAGRAVQWGSNPPHR